MRDDELGPGGVHEPVIPAENTRCRRCGGLLGMGQAMLLRAEAGQVDQIPQDPLGLLESSLQRHMDEMASDPARVLETHQEQMGRSRSDNVHPLKRLLRRLQRILKGPSPVGHSGYSRLNGDMFCSTCGEKSVGGRAVTYSDEDKGEGHIDLPRLVADAAFPVYGLKGSPLGLRLEGIGWSGKGNGNPVDRVTLTYVAAVPKGVLQAIELSQHADTTGILVESRGSRELNAIVSLVTSHGSEELRREYLRRGNIHRDWNLARISSTERRRLTVEVDGAPGEVNWPSGGSRNRWFWPTSCETAIRSWLRRSASRMYGCSAYSRRW